MKWQPSSVNTTQKCKLSQRSLRTSSLCPELKHEVQLRTWCPEQGLPSAIPPQGKRRATWESTSPSQLHLIHLVTEKTIWAWATGVNYGPRAPALAWKSKVRNSPSPCPSNENSIRTICRWTDLSRGALSLVLTHLCLIGTQLRQRKE